MPENPVPTLPRQEGTQQTPSTQASPIQQTQPSAPNIKPDSTSSWTPVTTLPTDWETVVDSKFKEIKSFYDKYAGQVGCNPYEYWHKVVAPLQRLFASRDTKFEFNILKGKDIVTCTKAEWQLNLFNSIMALETKASYAIIDPTAYKAEIDRRAQVLADFKSGRRQTIIA